MDGGDVRFVYIHYAFLGEESVWAAEAAECASEQGRFWEYHDALFDNWAGTNVGGYDFENLLHIAGLTGLDAQAFDGCMQQRRYVDKVRAETEFSESSGVNSTPTVFVNGEQVMPGSYDEFRQIVDAALAEAQ